MSHALSSVSRIYWRRCARIRLRRHPNLILYVLVVGITLWMLIAIVEEALQP
jgi:hypothetical protein